jgi:hypothetical protein
MTLVKCLYTVSISRFPIKRLREKRGVCSEWVLATKKLVTRLSPAAQPINYLAPFHLYPLAHVINEEENDCEPWVGGGRGYRGTWTLPQGIAYVLTFFLGSVCPLKTNAPFIDHNAETSFCSLKSQGPLK